MLGVKEKNWESKGGMLKNKNISLYQKKSIWLFLTIFYEMSVIVKKPVPHEEVNRCRQLLKEWKKEDISCEWDICDAYWICKWTLLW